MAAVSLYRTLRFVAPFLAGGCALLARPLLAQLPAGTNWALTFADEFNGTTLDSMKWSNGHPWDPGSSLASNVVVSGGYLDLNAVRTSSVSSSSSFTGAGISTENSSYNELFGMTYGYVEASMKMPSLPGSWPAFWMLESGWPPELDINEFPVFVNGTFSAYNYSDNIHYTDSGGTAASLGNGVHYAGVGDLTAGFHNYGMQWTPTSVTFYIDGNVQSTITDPTAIANLVKSGGGPMYIMLDNSGGGSWPGVPSVSQWPVGATSTVQVDWIRVWKDSSGSATSIAWNNTASNGAGSWTSGSSWSGGATPQLSSQTAVFGANAVNAHQTVNWSNSQTVGGLTFNSTTSYTIGSAAGSLMLAGLTSTGTATVLIDATSASGSGANDLNSRLELYNNVTMQTSSKPLIVNGTLIGTGNLTIAAGAVTLAASSTYSGGTTLNGGTLTAASNGALGSGAVQFNTVGNGYTAALALAGGIELDNPITLTARNNSTVAIDNSSGNNTLGGPINLQVGGSTYAIQSDAGQLTLSSGTAISVAAGVTGTRTVSFLGAGNTLVSGALLNGSSGTLAVTVNGSGSVVLSASNTYTGATTLAAGTLGLASSSALAGGGNLVFQGGTLHYSGSGATTLRNSIVNSAARMNFNVAGGTLQLGGNLAASNTGGLLATGRGTLVLAGSNSFSGGAAVSGGTLELLNSHALPDGSSLAVGGNARLLLDPGVAISPPSAAGDAAASPADSGGSPVPEPATLALLAAGAGLLWGFRGKQRKSYMRL